TPARPRGKITTNPERAGFLPSRRLTVHAEGPAPPGAAPLSLSVPSGGHECPARTPFSTLSPRVWSTLPQYWKARTRTGSVTPLSRGRTVFAARSYGAGSAVRTA